MQAFRAAVLAAGCGFFVFAAQAEDGAAQVWFMQRYAQRLDYGLLFELESEQRLQTEGAETFSRVEATPQLVWNYSPRYDFGAGYEFAHMWEGEGMEIDEHSGLFFFTLKASLADFLATSRQRFQFGVEGSEGETEDVAVFRHRLRVDWGTGRLPFRIKPFASNEWFFDLAGGRFSENRLMAGMMYEVNEAVALEAFGMRLDEWNEHGAHTASPAAGLAVNLEF